MSLPSSKYLIPNRLEDVLACIQLFASDRSGKKQPSEWAKRFGRGPSSEPGSPPPEAWTKVFEDHPEFFLLEKDSDGSYRASLLMRRAYDRLYDGKQNKEVTQEEKEKIIQNDKLSEEDVNKRFTRRPLTPDQIQMLISAAVELHDRAIARRAEARWKYSLLIPALSGLTGALLGALVPSLWRC